MTQPPRLLCDLSPEEIAIQNARYVPPKVNVGRLASGRYFLTDSWSRLIPRLAFDFLETSDLPGTPFAHCCDLAFSEQELGLVLPRAFEVWDHSMPKAWGYDKAPKAASASPGTTQSSALSAEELGF